MSQFFDKSSLTLIPSGYKDGKLYSQKPLSTDGELTFSRGSDIEATRVAANGYIEKAQVNLLLQSNTFSTTWTNFNSSETGGQSGYDGTIDAWLIDKSGANGNINQTISINGVSTFSVYAKKGTDNWIQIRMGSATLHEAFFDLENGVVGTESNLIASSIESAGNGYYRCSITANVSSVSYVRIYVADADNDTSGTSGNIYIQDAQVNYGLVAQTYQETTTAAVVSGITDNMPRLNYDPANPTCPSLLLEGSRSNAIAQSEFVDSWGVKTNISVVSNNGTSPEGVINASNIYPTTTGASFFYEGSITYTSGTTYTYSVFAKANGKDYLQITTSGPSFSNQYCTFDLALGATDNNGFESVGIEDYGNGWFRCYVVETSISTASSRFVIGLVSNANAGRLSSVTADGTNGVLIYGVVSETGSYPTSYIPTYGSSATRNADYASKSGIDSLIGQANGTLFFDFDPAISGGYGSGYYSIGVENGDYTNAVGLVSNSPAPTELRGIFRVAGGTGYVGASFNVSNQRNKIAIVYTASTIKLFKNGSLHASTSKGSFTNSMGAFNMTTAGRSGDYAMNQVLFFTSALSDAEAITLTSL